MTRTIVDVHILQTVPPSNINRDDTGSPKTAVFGGVRRARVSSQAWKRATRKAFDDLLDREQLGVRTKRLVEVVAERIAKIEPGVKETAEELATAIVSSTGVKLAKAPRKKSSGETEEHQESGYLIFVSRLQVDRLARAAIENAPDGDPAALKGFKGKDLLDKEHSIDLALFGRMVADVSDLNVDASAQVAHAISVHAVDNEYDYFTAVEDAKKPDEDEDAGAAMIGTVEFNSSTLYRYATVDVDRLQDNLGDVTAARRAVEAFITAFATSMPTGKQNTFANRTLPDAVLVTVRKSQPVNLVGAFEDPVAHETGGSRLRLAAQRLAARAAEVTEVLGEKPVASWYLAIGAAKDGLSTLADAAPTTLPELPAQVGALVEERLGTPR